MLQTDLGGLATISYHKKGIEGFPSGSVVKNLPANAGDAGLAPGSGRSLEKELAAHSSILYSCLENSMNRRARRLIVWIEKELDTVTKQQQHRRIDILFFHMYHFIITSIKERYIINVLRLCTLDYRGNSFVISLEIWSL